MCRVCVCVCGGGSSLWIAFCHVLSLLIKLRSVMNTAELSSFICRNKEWQGEETDISHSHRSEAAGRHGKPKDCNGNGK